MKPVPLQSFRPKQQTPRYGWKAAQVGVKHQSINQYDTFYFQLIPNTSLLKVKIV